MSVAPLAYEAIRPGTAAAIGVPQAYNGIVCGPVNDIAFLYATVTDGLAIAFAGEVRGKRFPKIVLGHLDKLVATADAMRDMTSVFGTHPVGLRVFVAVRSPINPVFTQVRKILEAQAINFSVVHSEGQSVTLVMDMATGGPVNPVQLSGRPDYRPSKILAAAYKTFAHGHRFREGKGFVPETFRRAFDLCQGAIPQGYNRQISPLPAPAPVV